MARPNSGYRLRRIKGRGDVWYITWTEGGRSLRCSTRTTDRQEAENVLAGFILESSAPTQSDGLLVEEALQDYLDEHVNAPGSRVVDHQRIGYAVDFLSAGLGKATISAIDVPLIRKYRRSREVGDGTMRRELGVLIAALNHAVKMGRLESAPYVELPPNPEPRDRWLTHEEAESLVESARHEMSQDEYGRFVNVRKDGPTRALSFVVLALGTGARKAAIEELRWDQVDLARRRITYNPPGRRQTKKRRPVVPINDDLHAYLEEAKRQAASEFVLGHPGSIRRAFRTAADRVGLYDVTPHTLRHTWATWAAQRGVPLWEIAGMLGDEVRTVERKYAHHHPDHLRGAADFSIPGVRTRGAESGA